MNHPQNVISRSNYASYFNIARDDHAKHAARIPLPIPSYVPIASGPSYVIALKSMPITEGTYSFESIRKKNSLLTTHGINLNACDKRPSGINRRQWSDQIQHSVPP